MAEQPFEKIKGEVASTLTKTYAEKMFDSIQDVSKGLADGAEGASKLHDGSNELHDGSSKVTDGLHTLQGKSGDEGWSSEISRWI